MKADYEARLTRAEALEYLEAIVEGLRKGILTISTPGRVLTLRPGGLIELELGAKQKKDREKLQLELEWKPGFPVDAFRVSSAVPAFPSGVAAKPVPEQPDLKTPAPEVETGEMTDKPAESSEPKDGKTSGKATGKTTRKSAGKTAVSTPKKTTSSGKSGKKTVRKTTKTPGKKTSKQMGKSSAQGGGKTTRKGGSDE